MGPPASDDATLIAVAHALGANALPGYCALLALLLLIVGAGARLVRPERHHDTPMPVPLAMFAVRFGLGFVVLVVAGLTFAGIADAIRAGERLARFDTEFSAALMQSTSARTLQVFGWITHLGDNATLAVLAVGGALVLVARGERWLALAWVSAIAGNAVLNRTLKEVFERVRPPHNLELTLAPGWSFPSGHSSGSVVAYGMLAYVLLRTVPGPWHLPAVLIATAAAFTTGCSRIFLQAHYMSDVVAGFASGAAWLAICIGTVEATRAYRARRGQGPR